LPKAGLFAAKTLEHRKRLLSRIRHFRREIGNGTVLHTLSLAVMHAGGKLALRRSSAPVRQACLLRRPTAALPDRACLLGAAYFACPSFGSPSPGANGKGIPHFSHVFAPGSLSNPHAGQ